MNSLLTRFLGRKPPLPRAAAPSVEATDVEAAIPVCGWFDSSHELHQGLWVREHASPDDVANDLPLAFWVELHLSQGRPSPAP